MQPSDRRKVVLTLAIADHDYPNGVRFTKETLRVIASADPGLEFSEITGFLECELNVADLPELVDGKRTIELKIPVCPGPFPSEKTPCERRSWSDELDCYMPQVGVRDLENGLRQLVRKASDTAYGVFLDRINWEEDAAFVLNPGLLARLPNELSTLENPTRFILEGVEVPVFLEGAVPYSDEKTFVYLLVKKIAGCEILCPDEDQPERIKNLAPWVQGRLEIIF